MNDPTQTGYDPFDLTRFVAAQQDIYAHALREIRAGHKQSHWMWFVFPQVRGLGTSATSVRYALSGLDEARAYLSHPVLGERLVECCEAVLASDESAHAMFGSPDDLKLQSCATLFSVATTDQTVFGRLIADKFDGVLDQRTLRLLSEGLRQHP